MIRSLMSGNIFRALEGRSDRKRVFFCFAIFCAILYCFVLTRGVWAQGYETIGLQPGSDATGVNFNWYSGNAAGNNASWVRISDTEGNIIEEFQGPAATATATTGKLGHKVSVTGLTQGKTYKYELSNDGGTWGAENSFTTTPASGFRFAAVTDAQVCYNGGCSGSNGGTGTASTSHWVTTVNNLVRENVNFIIHTGDQVDATSTSIAEEYNLFFSPDALRSLPFAPVMGNHDSHCDFMHRYNMPNEYDRPTPCLTAGTMSAGQSVVSGIHDAGNYYFLQNNVLFVGLNTSFYPAAYNATSVSPDALTKASAMVQKFEATINAAKAAYPGRYDFIVVFHHKSTQSIASHAADGDVLAYVEAGFEKLMTDQKVSLVMAGHDHVNVRSKFLVWKDAEELGEAKGRSVPNDNAGTVYLTLSTASGIKYYEPFNSVGVVNANFPYLADGTKGSTELKKATPTTRGNRETSNRNKWLVGMETYYSTHNGTAVTGGNSGASPEYTIVEVNGTEMKLITYRNDQTNSIDEFTITAANKPPTKAETPEVTLSEDKIVEVGSEDIQLSAAASVTDGGQLSYQWYRNVNNNNVDGTEIEGEDGKGPTLTVSTETAGVYYYYVVVTNTVAGGVPKSVASDVVKVVVREPIVPGEPIKRTAAWTKQLPTYGFVKGETIKAEFELLDGTIDNSISVKLTAAGLAGEVKEITTDDGQVYEVTLPAIDGEDIKCSSCEHYLGLIGGLNVAGTNGNTNVTDAKVKITDVHAACENLKTGLSHTSGTSAGIDDNDRYIHFTQMNSSITTYGGTARIFINGKAITPSTGTNGASYTLDEIKDLAGVAPEGGYYMYVHTSSSNQIFDVSGGKDYCKEDDGEGEDDPPIVSVPEESFETIGLQPGATAKDVNFNWYSNSGADYAESWVRILDADGETVKDVEGKRGAAITTTGSSGGTKYYHKVNVEGLTSDTEYKYQLSNDGTNWSADVYSYKTPSEGKFKFAAVTDAQLGAATSADGYTVYGQKHIDDWKEVAANLKNAEVNFIVHTGDQVDATSNDIRTEYTNFFSPEALRSVPFAPVMGNHDTHCEFLARYNLPNEYDNPLPEGCTVTGKMNVTAGTVVAGLHDAANYYYLYNNVLFVGLNTAYYPNSKDNAETYITRYENTINAAKEKYAGQYDFIVVHHHKSTQSVASHTADTDIEYYVQAGFERLMTANKVSLVLAGHDHINVRSKFVVWDDALQLSKPNETIAHPDQDRFPCAAVGNSKCGPFSTTEDINKGTVYLTLSTASGMKYYPPFDPTGGASSSWPYLVNGNTGKSNLSESNPLLGMERYAGYIQQPEYTIVEVDGETMTLKTYRNDNNALIDNFTITTENIFGGKHRGPVTPTIAQQPTVNKETVYVGDEGVSVTVDARITDEGTLNYQWYKNATASNIGGTELTGETNRTYAVPTTSVGTSHYYVVVRNTFEGKVSAAVKSNVATVVVGKGTPEYTVPAGLTATYGDLLSSVDLPNGWKWVNEDALAGVVSSQTHEAVFTPDDVDNYNAVTKELAVDVSQKEVTLDWNVDEDLIYNGNLKDVKAEVNDNDLVGEDECIVMVTITSGNGKDAGPHIATATGLSNSNYKLPTDGVTQAYTIDKAPAPEITFPTVATPAVTYNPNRTLADIDLAGGSGDGTFAWTDLSIKPTVGVTNYSVTFTPRDDDNYDYTGATITKTVTLTVSPATVDKPALASSSLVYNGKAQSVTLNPAGSYNLSGATGTKTNVGNYTAVVALDNNKNYKWADETSNDLNFDWKITKAALTVTAVSKTITYGEDAPNYTVSYSGFVDGEDEAVLGGTLSVTSTYTKGSNAGLYQITVSGLTSDNYAINYTAGVLTVNKAVGSFAAVSAINATHTAALTLSDLALPDGYVWDAPTTVLSAGNDQSFAVTYTHASGNYTAATGQITVNVAPSSILASDRIVQRVKPDEEATVIAPITVLAGEFTAGPNPVAKQSGIVNFFRQGKRIANSELRIYDAAGNVVNKVKITDNKTLDNQARRQVGSWNLTDKNGHQVSEGTYLVRGVVKTSDGKTEKVSVILSVR